MRPLSNCCGFCATPSINDEFFRAPGNGMRSGRKIVRRKMIGQQIAEYYPEDMSRMDPFMLDYNSEAAKLKLERLRRRGKAPPKKGAGKRSKR
ncbi:hypothetical protein H632_c120p0 [Helicosporidium sp. ATCC 50920]|nr:hypothetical protein H632_c120p0 [Helicosporidium sp. ATCC 50920]|eukprot:KDD76744.1 hypothetical protein H632_c120p0 [Helicosporidium sp. ATCC 50920]